MEIPVVFDDDTEGEFIVELCCKDCAYTQYGLSKEKFDKLKSLLSEKEPIKLPKKVRENHHFIRWMIDEASI